MPLQVINYSVGAGLSNGVNRVSVDAAPTAGSGPCKPRSKKTSDVSPSLRPVSVLPSASSSSDVPSQSSFRKSNAKSPKSAKPSTYPSDPQTPAALSKLTNAGTQATPASKSQPESKPESTPKPKPKSKSKSKSKSNNKNKHRPRLSPSELANRSAKYFNPLLYPRAERAPPPLNPGRKLCYSRLPPPCAELDDAPTARARRWRVWSSSYTPLARVVIDPHKRGELRRYQPFTLPPTEAEEQSYRHKGVHRRVFPYGKDLFGWDERPYLSSLRAITGQRRLVPDSTPLGSPLAQGTIARPLTPAPSRAPSPSPFPQPSSPLASPLSGPIITRPALNRATPSSAPGPGTAGTAAQRQARRERLKQHKWVLDQEHERRWRAAMRCFMDDVEHFQEGCMLPGDKWVEGEGVWLPDYDVDRVSQLADTFRQIRQKPDSVFELYTHILPVPGRADAQRQLDEDEDERQERRERKAATGAPASAAKAAVPTPTVAQTPIASRLAVTVQASGGMPALADPGAPTLAPVQWQRQRQRQRRNLQRAPSAVSTGADVDAADPVEKREKRTGPLRTSPIPAHDPSIAPLHRNKRLRPDSQSLIAPSRPAVDLLPARAPTPSLSPPRAPIRRSTAPPSVRSLELRTSASASTSTSAAAGPAASTSTSIAASAAEGETLADLVARHAQAVRELQRLLDELRVTGPGSPFLRELAAMIEDDLASVEDEHGTDTDTDTARGERAPSSSGSQQSSTRDTRQSQSQSQSQSASGCLLEQGPLDPRDRLHGCTNADLDIELEANNDRLEALLAQHNPNIDLRPHARARPRPRQTSGSVRVGLDDPASLRPPSGYRSHASSSASDSSSTLLPLSERASSLSHSHSHSLARVVGHEFEPRDPTFRLGSLMIDDDTRAMFATAGSTAQPIGPGSAVRWREVGQEDGDDFVSEMSELMAYDERPGKEALKMWSEMDTDTRPEDEADNDTAVELGGARD